MAVFLLMMPGIIACAASPVTTTTGPYEKHSYAFTSSFDTVIQLVAYTRTPAEFDALASDCEAQFTELHQLFDIYHTYEGLNNLCTVNRQAGQGPVQVDSRILDLLAFYREQDQLAPGKVNPALGAVLTIWSRYRDAAEAGDGPPALPSPLELEAAAKHTDPAGIVINRAQMTVQLTDPDMRLDVGAVAKGYATELVARTLEAKGLTSGIISAGGSNVRLIGQPLGAGRTTWQIGVQNPFASLLVPDTEPIDVIATNSTSIVTSGDYQRYYMVDGVSYHHLIDPVTLMPARYCKAVTIMTPDSGLADFLSTAVFLMPFTEGRTLVESLPDCEALWIFADGTIRTTAGMAAVLQNQGRGIIPTNPAAD